MAKTPNSGLNIAVDADDLHKFANKANKAKTLTAPMIATGLNQVGDGLVSLLSRNLSKQTGLELEKVLGLIRVDRATRVDLEYEIMVDTRLIDTGKRDISGKREVREFGTKDPDALVIIVSKDDELVCMECEVLARSGPMSVQVAQAHIPAHPNCILPGAMIEGGVVAASKSHYAGDAVEIVTIGGKRITLTPNHPVMTIRGFVAAYRLREGDQLLAKGRKIGGGAVSGGEDDKHHDPAAIEQIFETFAPNGLCRFAPLAEDFHGDAASINGEVEIVFSDRRLLRDFEALLAEERGEFILTQADVQGLPLTGLRSGLHDRSGLLRSASGVPSARDLLVDEIGVGLDERPLQTLCLGAVADWDTTLPEPALEGAAFVTTFVRQLLKRAATLIEFDEVVEVRRFYFEGPHVYDLQTTSGYMIANGLYISNCRCVILPYVAPRRRMPVTMTSLSGTDPVRRAGASAMPSDADITLRQLAQALLDRTATSIRVQLS